MSIFVREFLLFLIILISPVNDDCNRTPVFSFSRLSDRAFRWDMQVSWIKNFSVQRFARHPYVEPHWTQNLAHQFNDFIMLLSLMDELNRMPDTGPLRRFFLWVFTTKTAQLYQCNTKLRSEHENGWHNSCFSCVQYFMNHFLLRG